MWGNEGSWLGVMQAPLHPYALLSIHHRKKV